MGKYIKEEIRAHMTPDDDRHWNGYTVNNTEEVIQNLKDNDFHVINNHNDRDERIDGYLIIERAQYNFKYVAPVFNGAYFSVNPLYVGEDGRVHISTRSIGGAVAPFQHNGNMEKAIAAYNKEHAANTMVVRSLEEQIVSYIAVA